MVVCGLILGLTALGKIYALANGSGLLAAPHPFLPGTFKEYVWLGLAFEVAAFASLILLGSRAFLGVCLGLAILFVGYHTLQVALGLGGTCPCLGGFLGRWKPLAEAEGLISFLTAVGLGAGAFLGLFPVAQTTSAVASPQPFVVMAAVAASLWLLAGGAVIWLWQGRELGGDEGMEAAKSLQWLVDPSQWSRVWNDQPPLMSLVGAVAFKVFSPVMTVARLVVLLMGLCLPVTLAVCCSRMGVRWASVVAVILLWLALPAPWVSFMQEGPAYALALAALLPLLLWGHGRLALGVSALVAALALCVKLTAAFGLVVPFVWLWQRSWPKALGWGGLTVGGVAVASLFLPSWSWSTMGAAHLQSGIAEIRNYRLNPTTYAWNWLVCALALFAVGSRYLRRSWMPIAPWMVAAGVALGIHLVHRPFFGYYDVHLLTPLAVLGAVGMMDLCRLLSSERLSRLEQWAATAAVILACGLWGWQRTEQIYASYQRSIIVDTSPVVEGLKALRERGETVFSKSPKWTFASGMLVTPPELTILSLKRGWSGQMTYAQAAALVASNHVGGIVVSPQMVVQHSEWSNLLSGYAPTARAEDVVLYVRKDLNPKPIELDERGAVTQMLRRMGL